jgi:hypothetical protein
MSKNAVQVRLSLRRSEHRSFSAHIKALADKADKRRRQALAAATLADEQLCRGENEPSTTVAIVAAERVGREVAEHTARLDTVVEQERREAAECTKTLGGGQTHVGVNYFDVGQRAKMSAGGRTCSDGGQ